MVRLLCSSSVCALYNKLCNPHVCVTGACFPQVRDGQKQQAHATDGSEDTQRFLAALAVAQTRMEFDEECAVLLALEQAAATTS